MDKLGARENIRSVVLYGLGPLLGIASGPILARSLGPEGRGQFAAVMSPLTIAGAIASLGVPSAIVYFSAKGFGSRRVYASGVRLMTPIALITYAVMIAYAFHVSDVQGLALPFVVACWAVVIASAFVQVRRGAWQGLGRWRLLDIERGLFAISRFALVAGAALIFSGSAVAVTVGAVAAFFLSGVVLFRRLPGENSDAEQVKVPTRDFTLYAMTASLGTITVAAGSRLDQLLMPANTSSAELGFYAVAVTVAEIPLVLGTLMARNALQMAAAGLGMRTIFYKLRFFIFICAFLVTMTVGLSWFAVPIVFGRDFAPAVGSTAILSVGTFFSAVSLLLASIITGRGRPGTGSLIPLSAVLVTVVGFAVFWGEMTSLTAAIISILASGASMLVAAGMTYFEQQRRRRTPERRGRHSTTNSIIGQE